MILHSRVLVRSSDILNMLHLHSHLTNGQQTWQGGHLPWGASTHKVTWSFRQVVLWGQVINQINYISTCRSNLSWSPLAEITYHDRLPLSPLKSLDYSITWATCDHLKTWKCFIFWSLNLAGLWLWSGGSERKRLRRHRLVVIVNFIHVKSRWVVIH